MAQVFADEVSGAFNLLYESQASTKAYGVAVDVHKTYNSRVLGN